MGTKEYAPGEIVVVGVQVLKKRVNERGCVSQRRVISTEYVFVVPFSRLPEGPNVHRPHPWPEKDDISNLQKVRVSYLAGRVFKGILILHSGSQADKYPERFPSVRLELPSCGLAYPTTSIRRGEKWHAVGNQRGIVGYPYFSKKLVT